MVDERTSLYLEWPNYSHSPRATAYNTEYNFKFFNDIEITKKFPNLY
jgi:hypothetical protein